MKVREFRPQRPGPEAELQKAVTRQLVELFPSGDGPVWAGSSVPLGAGMPDLVMVAYQPEVFTLADLECASAEILAYLHAVRGARLSTILQQTNRRRRLTIRCLNGLVEAEAVCERSGLFSLAPLWRDVLPEIVTIEAKIKNWQGAVEQAARNRVFAHRSFVALPESLANRVRSEGVLQQLGLGLLSVGDDLGARISRRARRHRPRVWSYYYKLATLLATDVRSDDRALYSRD
jgi:hypothetical protein